MRLPRLASAAVLSVAAAGLAVAAPLPAHAAAPGIGVTEVAPWGSGNSPYMADWFELTNFGSSAVNIAGWEMDDDSNSFSKAVALNGVTSIPAGGQAVFIETTSQATVTAFKSFWFPDGSTPPGLQIGIYEGSGVGLSTGGDQVNIFNSSGAQQAHVAFGQSTTSAPFASFDNPSGADGTLTQLSQPGVNGAYSICNANGTSAVGSPGSIANGYAPDGSSSIACAPTTSTPPPSTPAQPWPGGSAIHTVDTQDLTTQNLSGLVYEGSGSTGRLWAVDNGPSVLFKLYDNGTNYVPEPGNWSAGKSLKYPDGSGDPDSEGVTLGGPTSADGVYVSTERDNDVPGTSKLAVLRYDANATGSTINANAEWDLTSAIPPTGANLGLEAITWVPDSYLVAHGLKDTTGALYDPSAYGPHSNGLFLVGVEGSGMVYAFELDQAGTTFHLVASAPSGLVTTNGTSQIMELNYEASNGFIWAHCDNNCNNDSTVLQVVNGSLQAAATYAKPGDMAASENNEGFATTPDSECSNGVKPVFFSDDGDMDGFSIREGTLNCSLVPASLPEFPYASLALVAALLVGGAGIGLRVRARNR